MDALVRWPLALEHAEAEIVGVDLTTPPERLRTAWSWLSSTDTGTTLWANHGLGMAQDELLAAAAMLTGELAARCRALAAECAEGRAGVVAYTDGLADKAERLMRDMRAGDARQAAAE